LKSYAAAGNAEAANSSSADAGAFIARPDDTKSDVAGGQASDLAPSRLALLSIILEMKTLLTASCLLMAVAASFAAYPWGVVEPEDGGFTTQMPGEPQLSTDYKPNVATYTWIAKPDDLILAVVGVTDYYSPVDVNKELEQGEKSFLKEVKGQSDSRTIEKFPGPKGKKLPSSLFTFHTQGGWTGKSRIIVDKDTAFQTVLMWRRMRDGAALVSRFEGSFRLLPRTKPPIPSASKIEVPASPPAAAPEGRPN
jgi:hypothetical protein